MKSNEMDIDDLLHQFDAGLKDVYPIVLEHVASALIAGETPPPWMAQVAAAELRRMVLVHASLKKKPGRPKGAKTRGNTPGKQRARRFFEVESANNLKPWAAAKIVAAEFRTDEARIIRDAKRHEAAITLEIAEEVGERIAAMTGPQLPFREMVLRTLAESLRSLT
jgi:hypothetical protein